MISDASPKGWGVTQKLQTGDILIQYKEKLSNRDIGKATKNESQAIFQDLFGYGQIFKELQIKANLIKSDSSTAIQDLAKQRAGYTLVAEVKKIAKLCQQLRKQTQNQHIPGVSNRTIDALSRLSTDGDYSEKRERFTDLCQARQITPTLYLFVTEENKHVDRFVAIGEEEDEAEWLNAFSRQ
ncbi:MAG: hypothetical protein EZS28_032180 [Streblomastix strix]|uniref:RNase H type-1 domain-containing protein n=1 Tax=Streblomastix strix TaxID=222440 RepID=A0A5J4UPT1_9EUKA|nr:MAG: hypothetical protein EZS28_032180 [Streblomastix strix]